MMMTALVRIVQYVKWDQNEYQLQVRTQHFQIFWTKKADPYCQFQIVKSREGFPEPKIIVVTVRGHKHLKSNTIELGKNPTFFFFFMFS